MTSLKSFLTTAAKKAAERLVRFVVAKSEKTATTFSSAEQMINTALTVLRALGMNNEARMMLVIVVANLAGRGESFPREIIESIGLSSGSAVVPTSKPVVVRQSAPIKPTQQAKPVVVPQPATAPARTLQVANQKTPEEYRDMWLGYLRSFVGGGHIDAKKTCFTTTTVFNSGVQLERDHWKTFFDALRKSDEIGGLFHLIDAKAEPSEVFRSAPPDMVAEYCFGQDGLAVKMKVYLNELDGEFPRWLGGKAALFLDLVWAVTQNSQLDPHQEAVVADILDKLERAGCPQNLVDDGREVIGRLIRQDSDWKGDGRLAEQLGKAITPEQHDAAQASDEPTESAEATA